MIVINVQDGETHFLCIPCYCILARDMVKALTDAQNPEVLAAMELAAQNATEQVPGPTGNRGRKNAPATADDPDLISTYEDIVEYDAESDTFS